MSPVYRSLEMMTPAQRRRIRIEKFIMPKWDIHVRMGGYQEPRPSEPRHHWTRLEGPPDHDDYKQVVCLKCWMRMPRSGPPHRTCFGAGRP